MGRDEKKKSKKSKRSKDKKDKRRRRDSESDEGSSTDEETRKAKRAHKLARRVEEHLKKHKLTGSGYTDEDNPFGDAQLSQRFVWGKKIEKQLAEGVGVRDMTARAELGRHRERLEEAEKVKKRQAQREAEREAMQAELEMIQRERAAAEAVELERKQERFLLEQTKAKAATRLREGRPRAADLFSAVAYDDLPGLDIDASVPAEDPTLLLASDQSKSSVPLETLRELCADVAQYRELEQENAPCTAYWAALDTVAGAVLAEAEREEALDLARARGEAPPTRFVMREAGWHGSIERDVRGMLAGKSLSQLASLEQEIKNTLGSVADPEYWQAVLTRLAVERTRAFLREAYADRVRRGAAQLMAKVDVKEAMGWGNQEEKEDSEGEEAEEADMSLKLTDHDLHHDGELQQEKDVVTIPLSSITLQPGEPRSWEDVSEDEREAATEASIEASYSPVPLPPAAIAGRESEVVPEEEDVALLVALRSQVRYREAVRMAAATVAAGTARDVMGTGGEADALYRQMIADPGGASRLLGATNPLLRYVAADAGASTSTSTSTTTEEERRLRGIAATAMGDLSTSGDAPFGGEVALESQAYWWHEKYRPRRPKYFNRVHTGYEWNKYNQTHYDADNPPPKTVQGYKFNIFYPDLIDKAKAPTYRVERDPEAPGGGTCILRFTAGPPYEDVAFRIVNKEWEYNYKKGFKSSFDRGILHLYFNFKRQRYRR